MEKEILRAKFERKRQRHGVWHTKVERGLRKQHVAYCYREREGRDEIQSYLNDLNGNNDRKYEEYESSRHHLRSEDVWGAVSDDSRCREDYEQWKREQEKPMTEEESKWLFDD